MEEKGIRIEEVKAKTPSQSPVVVGVIAIVISFFLASISFEIYAAATTILWAVLAWRYQNVRLTFLNEYSKKTGQPIEQVKSDPRFAVFQYNTAVLWSADAIFLMFAVAALFFIFVVGVVLTSILTGIYVAFQMSLYGPVANEAKRILSE